MTLSQLLTVALLNLTGAVAPGPDTILITRLATKSRKHALAASGGIVLGVAFWCSLTVFGAAAVIATFPDILSFVQIFGGAVLIYMGSAMLRSGWETRKNPPAGLEEAEQRLGSPGHSFRIGLATNLANAKAILFFLAIIAPLLPPDAGMGTAFVILAVVLCTTAAVFCTYALVVSTNRVRRRLLKAGSWIDLGSGVFFIVVALALMINGVRQILGA